MTHNVKHLRWHGNSELSAGTNTQLKYLYIPDHVDPSFRFMLTHHSGHVAPPVFLQVIGCEFCFIPAC